jgi:photosystem II stability/assembly factor-like uncharacterized protein
MRKNLILSVLLTFLCCTLSITLFSQTVDSVERPALLVHGAEHSVLLDVVKVGSRIVAVGERGVVVLSDDGGRTWRQAASVPVSVTLTKVKFVTPKAGWAVGHSGVVLHSEDGGETWIRQLDGKTAAQLALDAAQADAAHAGANNAAAQRALTDAQRLVSDGPDKPFLDLYFENEKTGFVVGAYGLIFRTEDGGATWKSWMDHVDNPRGMHIYSIVAQGSAFYLAGEQGLFLRSSDGGNKFTLVKTPYAGTYFTAAILPTGEVLLGGMRGNAYRSSDQGKSFVKIEVPVPVSLSASVVMADGTAIFSNQAGMLLVTSDKGQSMRPLAVSGLPPIADLADAGNGMLITVGYGGAILVPVSAQNALAKNGGAQ